MSIERKRLIKFLVTGGVAAGVNVGLRWVLNVVTSFEVAVVLAYLFAMALAFSLSRTFVFEPATLSVRRQFARFAMVNVVSLSIVWAVSVSLHRFIFPAMGMIWYPDTAAHVIGVMSPIFAAYFLHRNFTFRTDLSRKKM